MPKDLRDIAVLTVGAAILGLILYNASSFAQVIGSVSSAWWQGINTIRGSRSGPQ